MEFFRRNRRFSGNTLRDVSRPPELSRMLAIVVTDIVGSTSLALRVGDLAYAAMIEEFRACVRSCVHRFDGREFAHTGDGFIHTYDDPDHALEGACAIFRTNARLNCARAEEITLRGGVHCGRLVRSASGPIGVALNEACEIGQNAAAGKLWLSSTAHDALVTAADAEDAVVDLPKSGRRRIHEFDWSVSTSAAEHRTATDAA